MIMIIYPALLTILAIACWLLIYVAKHEKSIHCKHYNLLTKTGPVSYVLQLVLMYYLWRTDNLELLVLGAMLSAFGCFIALMSPTIMSKWKPSSRDLTQAILWGQAVFPLVLFSVPEANRLVDLALN